MLHRLLRLMATTIAPPSAKRLKTTMMSSTAAPSSSKPSKLGLAPLSSSPTSPLLATHNGHFHADEALAIYLLRLLPTSPQFRLLRTRDPSLLSQAHTVVDVGGEYDASRNRFDHHQRTFTTTFPNRATKLSSAGLVYLHFGKEIIAARTGLSLKQEDEETLEVVWRKVYETFVEALDANDNGIGVYDPAETKGLKKRFYDGGVGLGALVGDLNQIESEDEDGDEHDDAATTGENGEAAITAQELAQRAEDRRFLRASTLMGETFLRKLRFTYREWLPARTAILQAYASRRQIDPSGRILVLNRAAPWKDHLYTCEEEQQSSDQEGGEPAVWYVLYPESEHQDSKWRIQAVGASRDSFELRKGLPTAWRGVRDQDLSTLSGIEGCIFAHANGFIGGNLTKEGALAMARAAVEA